VALSCSLDGGGSADPDGTIVEYRWDFGDNAIGAGQTAQHTYTQTGTYTVTLTVTDDGGAGETASQAIAPISGLTARGYKLKGLEKVDLSWNGAPGTSYDVLRDGARIATVAAGNYTDNLNRKGSGAYRYKICQTGAAVCSNEVTVSF
jgi:serine protease